jgi:hypothetical protein
MMHRAYNIKTSCKLQQIWKEELCTIGSTQQSATPEFSRNTAKQQTVIGTADISGKPTTV